MRFLIDEDLPRSTANLLRQYAHEAIDVRDIGLRGAEDIQIAEYARAGGWSILTGDFDFADIRNYPPAEYAGIVILAIAGNASAAVIWELLSMFLEQEEIVEQIPGKLVIVEPGRVRLRSG
ncbi:MAG: DUF5615 family PIN-like protein [Hormoscilla sp. GM7CHS1pb]|nr:DUF5615 family PIN-like protein [Hormoscilla sp. GM7CHS1pb]